MTPDDLLALTRALPGDAPLEFTTEGGTIGPGYHVTELKMAQIVSVDCGARKSAWTEATLQLLDGEGGAHMTVGKFSKILAQSARHLDGLGSSPLRVEFAHGNVGMQIFEPTEPKLEDGIVTLGLRPVRAHCKPAIEWRQFTGASGCCGSKPSVCCA